MKLKTRRARKLRLNATDAENKLWYHLSSKRMEGLKFRRQHPIDKFFADFACCSLKLIIEVDGGHHNLPGQIEKDQRRETFLEKKGYSIIRVWNNEVLENIDGVLENIRVKCLELSSESSP